MVIDVHLGGPLVLFELYMLFELPSIVQRGNLIDILPNVLLIIGQVLFLVFRTVKKYTLWLLLLSPLFIITDLIVYAMSLTRYRFEVLQTMIPSFMMTIVFDVHCFLKLRKNVRLTT